MRLALKFIVPEVAPLHHHKLVVAGQKDRLWDLLESVHISQGVDNGEAGCGDVRVDLLNDSGIHVVLESEAEAAIGLVLMMHLRNQTWNNWTQWHDASDLDTRITLSCADEVSSPSSL